MYAIRFPHASVVGADEDGSKLGLAGQLKCDWGAICGSSAPICTLRPRSEARANNCPQVRVVDELLGLVSAKRCSGGGTSL